MEYIKKYEQWKTDIFFDAEIREELSDISDIKEIEDRFYRDLEFGTGGLRGVMGAGTNRMNKYTVGKATKGLGRYLLKKYGNDICNKRGVVIGYDTRNNSDVFSKTTANILSGMGIRVYLYEYARPTPQLSFSVRYLGCIAGVVITASHNTKEYNGYKVYDEYGCQIVPRQAKEIIACINEISDYHEISFEGNKALIEAVDLTDEFCDAVLKQSMYGDVRAKADLKVVYTPLHGTGQVPVLQTLHASGFTNVFSVKAQSDGNGDFPTVVTPNPEDKRALEMAIVQAEKCDADIVLGTDPDCDRVNIAVKTKTGYQLMTANQIGALLIDYILENTDYQTLKKPAIIKTVVTSDLGAEIARRNGLTVFSTLTGFKYIGEKITQFERAKQTHDIGQDYDFVFAYEESYGYLAGTHARDKDAVVSSMLILEMAAKCKIQGKNLMEKMNEIYAEYGYYKDTLDSFTLKGKDGLEKISEMMAKLRKSGSLFDETCEVIDYSIPVAAEDGFGMLPTSNVIKFILKDGSFIAVRPSGTEPKIKIYYSVRGADKRNAEEKFIRLQDIILKEMALL